MAKLSRADDIALLRYIIGFDKTHHYMPSIRDIQKELGLKSPSPADRRVKRLVALEYVARDAPGRARAMRVTKTGRRAIREHEAEVAAAAEAMSEA